MCVHKEQGCPALTPLSRRLPAYAYAHPAFHNKSNAKKHVPRCSQGSKTCGKLSACQKNEQKPIKRSGKQTNWKRRHLAVLRRLAKKKPRLAQPEPAPKRTKFISI